jgi:hypothetical protein
MASTAQIEANRSNARKSTGPRTDAGKAASSRNALKHGLCAATAVLPDEDPAEFEAFAEQFKKDCDPHGKRQELLVERLTVLHWKLQRLPAMEQAAVRQLAGAQDDVAAAMERDLNDTGSRLERLQRYEGRITREIRALTRELRLLKQESSERWEEEHHAFCDGYNRALYDCRGKWPKKPLEVPEWVRHNYDSAKPSNYTKPPERKFESADDHRMCKWDFEEELGPIEWQEDEEETAEAVQPAPAEPAPPEACAAKVA